MNRLVLSVRIESHYILKPVVMLLLNIKRCSSNSYIIDATNMDLQELVLWDASL